MIDYGLILLNNYIDKQWSVVGSDYDGINWLDESPKPTKEELDSQWSQVQTNIDAHAYIAKRQAEYPFIGDQLDMLWHAIDTNSLNKTSDFYTAIKAVKDAYPKSE